MRRAFIFSAIVALVLLLAMFFAGFFMHGDPAPSEGSEVGAASTSCTERVGSETLFVGEARCLATLPQGTLSGYWVNGFEYSVFYTNKEDIKLEPDEQAAWLFLSSEAEEAVKDKMRADGWQVFAIKFIGAKSTARGVYGPGPFEAGVHVSRVLEIHEVAALR